MPDQIFKYIQQRCFNKPLLIESGKARVISDYLERRMNMEGSIPSFAIDAEDDRGGGMVFEERPVISGHIGGIAVIPIVGTLVNRSGNMDAVSGITSHRAIRNEVIAAANDRSIKAILLDIDSGGGEVEGNFDLGRLIRRINDEVKPVVAIANGDAYSGAFSLGVSAGNFYMTETGGVGSVGVIIQHVDYSNHNEMVGITVTNVKFGENKDLFSSDSPLSDEAKAVLQKEVNRTGELFVNHVAQMRNISKETVIDTKAGLLFGQEAVNINFVDGIISFDDLLEDMIDADFPIGPIESERMSAMFIKDKQNSTSPASKKSEGEEPETPEVEGAEGEEASSDEPEASPAPADEPASEPTEPPATAAEGDPAERAAMITEMCVDAGIAQSASAFIRSSMTVEQVKGKINTDTQVRQACVLAGKPDRADAFIKNGTPLSEVQSTLISEAAEDQDSNEVHAQQEPNSLKADLEEAKKQGRNVVLEDAKRRQEKAKQSKGAE